MILFLDSFNAIRLNAIIDECLENLFNDLIQKPELNDLKFTKHIKETVTGGFHNLKIENVFSLQIFFCLLCR